MEQIVFAAENNAIDRDFGCDHQQNDDAEREERQSRIDSTEQPAKPVNVR